MNAHDDLRSASEQPWLAKTCAALDQGVAELDAASLSRLNRARQAALDQIAQRPWFARWLPARGRWLMPTGLAAAASVAFMVTMVTQAPNSLAPMPATSSAVAQDFEMLSSQDSLDLYEDQEFFAWLDAQQSPSSG